MVSKGKNIAIFIGCMILYYKAKKARYFFLHSAAGLLGAALFEKFKKTLIFILWIKHCGFTLKLHFFQIPS